MANCTNCSAPLPTDTICCEYCGSRNDIDLKGINYYTTHENESARLCPRCNINLRTVDLKIENKFLIERCDECLGLFFDPGELEALLAAEVSNVFAINRSQLETINKSGRGSDYAVSYIKCPICTKLMHRVNFGARSGVIVDRCKEHGVWLDGGELRSLLEWMKAGGKLLQQEKEEEQKKAEIAKLEKERRSFQLQEGEGGGCSGESDFSLFGQTLRDSDPDLFTLVSKAIRFFVK